MDGVSVLAAAIDDSIVRGIHLFAAMVAVGALVFQRVALRPALDETGSAALAEAVRRRWAPWVHGTITILLATGFWRFFTVGLPKGEADPSYHMWFGMKFLAALGVFFVASALIGRSPALARFRNAGRATLGAGILLAIAVIAISVHLRELGTVPHDSGPEERSPSGAPAVPGEGGPPRSD